RMKAKHHAHRQQQQRHARRHADRPRDGARPGAGRCEQDVFEGAAHRRIRAFFSRAAPAQAISSPVATYIAAATANAPMPAAESVAILDTSAVSSRPGNGTCDASEVDSISAISSEVIGCTTARSACGNTTVVMMC